MFSSDEADVGECSASLGRECGISETVDLGAFIFDQTDFFSDFEGLAVVEADEADEAADIQEVVPKSAGNTLST